MKENGSVRFDRLDGFEFWLTPMNYILVFDSDGKEVYPNGSDDAPAIPAAVEAKLRVHLVKQRRIRKQWGDEDKDAPDAMSFSDIV